MRRCSIRSSPSPTCRSLSTSGPPGAARAALGAAWAAPCRMVAPEVARTAAAGTGRAIVLKVDTERLPAVAARYRVQSIPNFVVFRHGRVVEQRAGAGRGRAGGGGGSAPARGAPPPRATRRGKGAGGRRVGPPAPRQPIWAK